MKDIDDIFNDWNDEEWNENDYSLNELKNELQDCANDHNSYFETLDDLRDVCESYMKYNVITDYDVKWDNSNKIDIYLNPVNKIETINLNITIQ